MIEETHNHANLVLSSPLHLKRHRNIMNYATCANLNAGLCWYQKLNQGTSGRNDTLPAHSDVLLPLVAEKVGQRYVRLGGP